MQRRTRYIYITLRPWKEVPWMVGVIACETSPSAYCYIPLQPPLAYIKQLKPFFVSEGGWSGYMTGAEYTEYTGGRHTMSHERYGEK
jgi:hypothetical protein